MRAAAWVTIVVLGTLSAWGQAPQKKRVAVFDFDNAAVQGGMRLPFAETNAPNLGKAAADLLIVKLVQQGDVSVIERNAIDKLLAEQNFSNTDRTDPVTAAKLGKILGVDTIILGTITHYDYADKTTGGRGASRFGGFGGSAMKTKHDINAKVQISTRLVSPDTAEVLAVSQGTGEVNRKGVKVDIRDMNQVAMLQGNVNNPLMNECMDNAVAQLAGQLKEAIPKLPARTPVIDGLVADANPSGQLAKSWKDVTSPRRKVKKQSLPLSKVPRAHLPAARQLDRNVDHWERVHLARGMAAVLAGCRGAGASRRNSEAPAPTRPCS